MNILNDWISESLLYAMGWTLVHSLWQLVILSAGLWVFLKIFRKNSTAFKYNLSLATLGISLLATLGTFIYEVSNFTPTPLIERLAYVAPAQEFTLSTPSFSLENFIAMSIQWIELQLPLLVNVWFFGAMLFLFRLVNSLSEVRTLRKSSSDPQDFELEKMLYRLMGKMNVSNKVEIRLTSFGVSPITFGFLKPIILIPAGLILHLTPVQLEAIIAHELAHVKRNDYLANLLQSALEVLFFYHPCYWWMNQTVKELRENAADDLAVKVGIAPMELAYSLAEVLNFAKQNPPEVALAATKKRNPTLQRIKRILGHPAQTYPQNPIISIPMLLTLLLSAGLMATAQQDVPVTEEKAKTLNETSDVIQLVDIPVGSDSQAALTSRMYIKGDTIITKGDTIIVKSANRTTYTYITNGDTLMLADIPTMDLPPMPVFPADEMMPIADFIPDPFPVMDFALAPVMDFDMGTMPAMDFDMGTMPAMDFMINPPAYDVWTDSFSPKDTINKSKAEKEKWLKELELRTEDYSKKMDSWEAKMKPNLEAYEKELEKWQKAYEPKMEEFEKKMKEWEQAYEPKLKEFEKRMAEWEKTNGPKMKEFEARMEAWQKANEPKMKEYEMKIKEWEDQMQPKMEEYQRKMEIWQKENAHKIEEFQKRFQEALKAKDDNK